MVVDICATCGEEHEPPRGNKCKRTKLTKRVVKAETVSSGEEAAGAEGTDSAAPAPGNTVQRRGVEEYIEEDEEERALRRKLAARACERRKKALRAALEETASGEAAGTEEDVLQITEKCVEKGTEKTKEGAKKKSAEAADSDDSPSDSSSSSSSSDSEDGDRSRSRSRSRRKKKRSKFAINKFTLDEKSLKKVTVTELLYAALMWGVKRSEEVGMTFENLRRYMGHCAYMCMHAATNNYADKAFRNYDRAVREKAKKKGLKAFRMGDGRLTLLHFNLDNTRNSREIRKPTRQSTNARNFDSARKICYAFNYNKDGCSVSKCEYEHRCIVCKSSDHTIDSCKKKKY